MDSDLTLVNPAPPTPYFLSSTDLRNTIIFAHPAVPLYRVTSDTRHIKITDGTSPDRTIAILHRRDLLSDTISFPQRHDGNGTTNTTTNSGSHMTLHRWLKRSKLPDGTAVFSVDTDYGRYVWRITSRYRQKVFAEYDLESPVASCYLHQSLSPSKPAFVLQSAGEPIRDDIVVAYLVQRHRVTVENKALDLFDWFVRRGGCVTHTSDLSFEL